MTKLSNNYKIENGNLVRTHRTCPKCGVGYFLADHYDRSSCGRCGYTIFKRKGKSTTTQTTTARRSPRKRNKST